MNTQQLQQAVQAAASLLGRGEVAAAESALRPLLRALPDSPQVLQLMAVALYRQGKGKQSVPHLQKAIKLAPGHAALWSTLAEIQRSTGDLGGAVKSADQAVALDSNNLGARFNRGLTRSELKDHAGAIEDLKCALNLNPAAGDIRHALARELLADRQHAEALSLLLDAAREKPPEVDEMALLARAAIGAGRIEEADQVLSDKPGLPSLKVRAQMNFEGNRWVEALAPLKQWLEQEPDSQDAQLKLAAANSGLARHAESEAAYRLLLSKHPDYSSAWQNLLVQIHYQYGQDNQRLFAEHQEWAQRFSAARPQSLPVKANTQPKKIAMISPRFTEGPPGRLGLALVRELAANKDIDLVLYRSANVQDATTEVFRNACTMVDVFDLDDKALARRLRKDAIEVLVDWVGHAPGNRLTAMSGRLAPLQLTWLDYFDTTGIPCMDGVISDASLTPAGSTQRFTETVYRLPNTRWCYQPMDAPLPATAIGGQGITFGSFNRLAKLTDGVILCWAELLRQVSDSRLLLKALDFVAPGARNDVLQRFSSQGIASDQIELRGFSDYPTLLAEYAEVDIALDPFPFTGCLTTCDALWMGVPVISMALDSLVSRQGLSLLNCIGRTQWVADSTQDYVEKAIALSEQVRQGWSRAALREQVASSPLCDATQFAEDFLAVINQAWADRAPKA